MRKLGDAALLLIVNAKTNRPALCNEMPEHPFRLFL